MLTKNPAILIMKILSYTKTKNGVAIFSFENPYGVEIYSDRLVVIWISDRYLSIVSLPKNQHLASCQYRAQIAIYQGIGNQGIQSWSALE